VIELSELRNPKQEIITRAFRQDDSTSGEIEILEPVFLSSFQHGYFVAGADHQLTSEPEPSTFKKSTVARLRFEALCVQCPWYIRMLHSHKPQMEYELLIL
jgi:hypothetical protein